MIGAAKNTNTILQEAAGLKAAYDTAYTIQAAHEGILSAKHELLGCLRTAIEERRQPTDDSLQTRVGHLVAHNLHLQADQLQKETYTLHHLVTSSSMDVTRQLDDSRAHFMAHQAIYIDAAVEYGQSLAATEENADCVA